MKKNIIVCAFLFSCLVSAGQDKDTVLIIPGSNVLQPYQLKNYQLKYDFISIKEGIENKVGGLEDEFVITMNAGIKMGLRVCNIKFGTNSILDSGMCFLAGLTPVYHHSLQTKKKISLDFSSNAVTGNILFHNAQGDSSEAINYISATALFDSYYEDMIAKSMKFKKGFLFRFPEYIYERGGLVWSTGEVADKVEIPNKNGSKDIAWKILFFENDPKGAIVRTTTYMIKESNREIITREYKTKNGLLLMRQREN